MSQTYIIIGYFLKLNYSAPKALAQTVYINIVVCEYALHLGHFVSGVYGVWCLHIFEHAVEAVRQLHITAVINTKEITLVSRKEAM